MQFIDRAKISVTAGKGGDGKSAFRHEKYVPKGGPSGGDGGRGADIVFVVDNNLNTLLNFRFKRIFKGENGGNGDIKDQFGKSAEPLEIKVPPGTVIFDANTGEKLADLTMNGQREILARGGRGGRGNARFKSSARRAPTFAELGEPGESRELRLELKLLADVGLVGFPSVGKSSLISVVSAAKPEIADYHFTTLTPVLGVVQTDYEKSYVMADIPGLIEGAADGAGLGHDFLRHIERTKLILHMVDASGIEGRDPVEDFFAINRELEKYSEKLSERTQILVANKIDLPSADENLPRLKKLAEEQNLKYFEISAATRAGVDDLKNYISEWLDQYVEIPDEEKNSEMVFDLNTEEDVEKVTVTRNPEGEFVVTGKSIEKLVAMTNFSNKEGLRRFQQIWRKKNLDAILKERGIKEGMTVRIGDMVFDYSE